MEDLRTKYDLLAGQFAVISYSNLCFDMGHRFDLAVHWRPQLQPGHRVLELGCGDGYLGELLVGRGFRYTGLDLSPQMVEVTRGRLEALGAEASCVVADISEWQPRGEYDAIISYMRSFFEYVREPSTVLTRLASRVRKKIIVDLDPRKMRIADGIKTLQKAGFRDVEWRPFLVPKTRRLPLPVLRCLTRCETVPLVRSLPLRWKFHVMLKAEPP